MRKAQNLYTLANILSIDVALGAWGMGNLVAKVWDTQMPIAWQWVLPLSVWIVYTTDHLLDAYSIQSNAVSERHLFHVRYFKPLFIFVIMGLLLILGGLYFLPSSIIYGGLGLSMLVFLHFLAVKWSRDHLALVLAKEWGVGMIYTLGIWMPPICVAFAQGAASDLPCKFLMMGVFFLLVMTNLLSFAFFEIQEDAAQSQSSWVRYWGREAAQKGILGMIGGVVLYNILLFFLINQPHLMLINALFAFMNLVHGIIIYGSSYFSQHYRYRKWGDALFFLTPLAFFVIEKMTQ